MTDTDPPADLPAPCSLPALMTIAQVARELNLSERQVRNLFYAGRLERVKMGDSPQSAVRVPKESFLSYLASLRGVDGSTSATDLPIEGTDGRDDGA
jgi:hypothetical protein